MSQTVRADERQLATRAAVAGASGIGVTVLVAVAGGGFDLEVPLPVYLGLGIVITLVILAARRAPDPRHAFVVSSSGGMALLAVFAADSSPGVPLAMWWPAWGLHAANAAHALEGRQRTTALSVGSLTLWGAILAASIPASEAVLHLGSYVVLSGLVVALAEHHVETAEEHAEATARIASRTRLLGTLARMNRLETHGVGDVAVRGLADAGYEMGTFAVVDEDERTVTSVASVGFAPDVRLDQPVPVDRGLAGAAFEAGRTVVIEDYREWSGRIDERDEIAGAVGVPVLVDGRPSAVLLGARTTPGAPSADQLEVIEILAAQAARVLLNVRRFDEEQRTAARLAELDAMEEDFIASVTHELRTPLTILQAASETLTARRDLLDDELRRSLIASLLSAAKRLDGLIGTLLYVSQLEAEAVVPIVETVDTRDLVEEAVRHAAGSAADAVELTVDVPAIDCDPELIGRVLRQLVANALVHNPAGVPVAVRVEEVGTGVRFAVRDEGVGIDPGDEPNIGRRFYRGGPSTRRSSSGLGLGLPISDQLLRAHGSELELTSSPGRGTTAAFVLTSAATEVRRPRHPAVH